MVKLGEMDVGPDDLLKKVNGIEGPRQKQKLNYVFQIPVWQDRLLLTMILHYEYLQVLAYHFPKQKFSNLMQSFPGFS